MRQQVSVSALVLLAASAGVVQQAIAQEEDLKLEEVLVTAERREANLQEVPLAVSAFTPEEMERRQAFNVVDVVSNVPNLVGNNNIGQGTATTVFLRGIGSTESIVTLETALGFYIDDVYISRQGVNNLSLFDVERVEVLRGPQGTLYGRNTTGGAIKVITSKPTNEFAASAEGSIGSFDRWSFKGSLNLPASESLALRLNGFIEQGDGYSDNLFDGREVNDTDGVGARAAMRWSPSEAFALDFSADYYKSDQAGLYGSDIGGIIRPRTRDYFTVDSGTNTSNIGRTYGSALTLNWNISDALQLQSITGFRNVYQKWNLDLSDQPVSVFLLYTINDTDSISQEFKLNGTAANERLKYTAGIFGYKEESFSFIGDSINLWLGGPRVPLPFFSRNYDVDVTSFAAFAEATFDVTDRFSITAGARYTDDDKELVIDAFAGGAAGFAVPAGALPNYNCVSLGMLGVPCELGFSKFTPKLGLQFEFTDYANAYLNYSKGWKSGGWSARTNTPGEFVVFEPETVDSFELGVKTTLLDGRARVNYTAYRYNYKDFFSTATGTAGNFIVFTSDAVFRGLEIESTVRASDRLDVFAALGLARGEYKDRDPLVFGTSIGEEPQRIPGLSLKLGGTYTRPVGASADLRLSADYNFLEDHYTNLQNSELARSGNVEVVNALVGVAFGDGRYDVGLSCRNCFDNEYISQSLDFSGLEPSATTNANPAFNGLNFLVIYPGQPRTWALTFKAKF
jgi:iron complex outermembrane receptor protein